MYKWEFRKDEENPEGYFQKLIEMSEPEVLSLEEAAEKLNELESKLASGKTKANDLVSPQQWTRDTITVRYGLTKREYFAAMALQGMFADSRSINSSENMAWSAVIYAHALISELNKEQK